MHRQRGRGRGAGGSAAIMGMLAMQIARLPYKPPITLALVGLQSALYLNPSSLPFGVRDVCLLPSAVLQGHNAFLRLILSAFLHGSDNHLYFNMTSFLWKGVNLEHSLGSSEYIRLLLFLLIVSHGLVVVLAMMDQALFGLGLMNQCAVGFSAVLFGLKVVLNINSDTYSRVAGMNLPTKYAAWAELVLIQLSVPNASFVGHLAGILAGLLWYKLAPVLPRLPEFDVTQLLGLPPPDIQPGQQFQQPPPPQPRHGRAGYGHPTGPGPYPPQPPPPQPQPQPRRRGWESFGSGTVGGGNGQGGAYQRQPNNNNNY